MTTKQYPKHYFHNNKKGDIFSNVLWNDFEISVLFWFDEVIFG